jgi:nucleotide-binding universal stress UspA family protein
MKLLIGIDGSEHSFAAATVAARLLVPGRDQIALYHACTPVEVGKQIDESLRDRACQAVANVVLDEAKSRLPQPLQTSVETITDDDRAASGLIAAADRWGAEMIAVGARGLGRIEGLLMGGVSTAVVRAARVPVLIVRQPIAETERQRIILAYDSANPQQQAAFLQKLNWPPAAEGRVVVVIESMLPGNLPDWIQKRARDADTEAMSQVWVEEHQQTRAAKEQELTAYQQQLPAPWRPQPPLVLEGNPGEQLMALLDREKPSLVIVGKAMKNLFDRFFIGSVSEKVLAHSKCSVLVIPAVAS